VAVKVPNLALRSFILLWSLPGATMPDLSWLNLAILSAFLSLSPSVLEGTFVPNFCIRSYFLALSSSRCLMSSVGFAVAVGFWPLNLIILIILRSWSDISISVFYSREEAALSSAYPFASTTGFPG
jgi:hypothetical protein